MLRKKPIDKEAACLRMADLCARAEHCTSEIREKLRKLALPSSDIDSIILYLQENRYIDDRRFALAFTRDKVRFSGWGRLKIRAALSVKRIEGSLIREAAEEIEEEEYLGAALKAGRIKARGLELTDYNDRMRLFRHLASRGFETSIVSQAISILRKEEDFDE